MLGCHGLWILILCVAVLLSSFVLFVYLSAGILFFCVSLLSLFLIIVSWWFCVVWAFSGDSFLFIIVDIIAIFYPELSHFGSIPFTKPGKQHNTEDEDDEDL